MARTTLPEIGREGRKILVLAVVEEIVRNLATNYVAYAWMLALIFLTYEVLHTQRAKKIGVGLYRTYGVQHRTMSYVVLGVLGAALFIAYWVGVQKAYARYSAIIAKKEE